MVTTKVAAALGMCVVLALMIACRTQGSAASSDTGSDAKTDAEAAKTSPPAVAAGIPAPADVAKIPDDAQTLPSGLASRVLKPGSGTTHPAGEDQVEVHYTGWTTDGKMFDSSVSRGMPAKFPLNRVIRGWTEGLQLMVLGEKRRLWIPADMAYGTSPPPGAPAGMLVFDVELLQITPPFKPLPAPEDVARPPKGAHHTASHLAYKVLTKGTGKRHPKGSDQVEVHYSGWTTDGKMFDSSYKRNQSATFGLNDVIAGWTEGLKLMVEGEKARFWIPVELAYNHQPGRPDGMLVFDVELLAIR